MSSEQKCFFVFKTKTRKWAQQSQAASGSPIFGRKYVRMKFFITPWRFQIKSMKIVIFDRKILVPNICCTQPVFSISVKPWKSTSGEPGGRRCRISTPAAFKNVCRLFLKRKRGLTRFCAIFDTRCRHWLENKQFSTRPWRVIYLWQCTLGATTSLEQLLTIARADDGYLHLTCVYYFQLLFIRSYSPKHTRNRFYLCNSVQFHQSDLK